MIIHTISSILYTSMHMLGTNGNDTHTDPMVKLLLSALKSSGCPIEISRHVSCESCKSRVNGGFDPTVNQVTRAYYNTPIVS